MSRQNPAGSPQPVKSPITMPLLETIKTPVLLMTGATDIYAPPPLMRLYAARIKSAGSVVIPEAGHSAYWEQPDIFNRAVLELLASIDGRCNAEDFRSCELKEAADSPKK